MGQVLLESKGRHISGKMDSEEGGGGGGGGWEEEEEEVVEEGGGGRTVCGKVGGLVYV